MLSRIPFAYIYFLLLFLPFSSIGQTKDLFTFSAVHKIEERNSYSIFYPPSDDSYKGIVILIHSAQASNPKVYGNLLNELLRDNYIIIYPAYQDYVVSQNKSDLSFISKSITKAYSDIKKSYDQVLTLPVIFMGHSMGGIIVFELASGKVEIPKMPSAVISLCPAEVSHHKLEGINFEKLDWYDVYLIIEEEGDKYYRRGTGERLLNHISPGLRQKYIVHKKDEYGRSSHMNAWSYNKDYSSKNNTFITYYKNSAGRTNEVDETLYWATIKEAIGCAVERKACESYRKE